MSERDPTKDNAAKGGKARAKNLSAEERSEIARNAAQKRWGTIVGPPRAIYGAADRPLKIGDVEIPCYVLEDGTRVLVQRGLQAGVGMSMGGGRSGARRLTEFLLALENKGIDISDLVARVESPIKFTPSHGGIMAHGYEATILADICDVVLEARNTPGALSKNQQHYADRCEVLVRSFAKVGIIALVDEATGYQADRERDALAVILERFIAVELQRWVKTFPPSFYENMFRLKGWSGISATGAKPAIVGKMTNEIVYSRLAPGVLEELNRVSERNVKGRLKKHFHRRLTREEGHPALREHLASVVTMMELSDDWDSFTLKLNRLKPKFNDTYQLPLGDDVTG